MAQECGLERRVSDLGMAQEWLRSSSGMTRGGTGVWPRSSLGATQGWLRSGSGVTRSGTEVWPRSDPGAAKE